MLDVVAGTAVTFDGERCVQRNVSIGIEMSRDETQAFPWSQLDGSRERSATADEGAKAGQCGSQDDDNLGV